jgi:uncharacterized membrane protein
VKHAQQHRHPANVARHDKRDLGQRAADGVARAIGSWRFILIQTAVIAAWITVNAVAIAHRWDPYPFILLNLLFSTQAAYAAPVLQLSQNRQAEHDRTRAEHDYEVNETTLTLTREVHALTTEVHALTAEMHRLAVQQAAAPAVHDPAGTAGHAPGAQPGSSRAKKAGSS